MERLAFVETKEQIEALEKFGMHDLVLCPVTPDALYICEEKNYSHIRQCDCYSQEDYDQAKQDSLARTSKWRDTLNAYSREIGLKRIGFPLEIGNYYLGLLISPIGAYHQSAFMIAKVIEHVNPKKIISFSYQDEFPKRLGIVERVGYPVFAKTLPYTPYHERATYLPMPATSLTHKIDRGEQLRSALRNNDLVRDVFELRKHDVPWSYILLYLLNKYLAFLGGSKQGALFVGPLYNYGGLFKDGTFVRYSVRLFWGEDLPNRVASDQELDEFLARFDDTYCNVPIHALIRSSLAQILEAIDFCCSRYSSLCRMVEKSKFIVSSVFLFPTQQMIAHIATKLGKKVYVWSHGSAGFTDGHLSDEACNFLYTDGVLTFGEAVNRYFRESYPMYRGDLIPVGSSLADRAGQPKEGEGTYILYATGKYLLNLSCFNDVKETDEVLYDAQKHLLEYFRKQRYASVIFKKNPTRNLGDIPFETTGLKVIQFEKRFVDLVGDAKVIVLDSPSTAVFEASASKKPIFVLHNRLKYTDEALFLISKRVVVCPTIEILKAKLDAFFLNGTYEADVNNEEFVKLYSTHLNDGRSLDRARSFFETKFGLTSFGMAKHRALSS